MERSTTAEHVENLNAARVALAELEHLALQALQQEPRRVLRALGEAAVSSRSRYLEALHALDEAHAQLRIT